MLLGRLPILGEGAPPELRRYQFSNWRSPHDESLAQARSTNIGFLKEIH